ncbi:maleylpyruvate isomerase N-terminal domain-containing protein [Rhodovulum sp. DZ06]|uniref:maleylpyruvate isomerase N-terminal domain-containing protein n=1 Tax=Rhodovulum sp. DZ06 TaxID=3425126 RepID=UPI003D351CC6
MSVDETSAAAPDPDAAARAALRERQGAGARWDAEAAPAGDLLLARRAAAYFARKLRELPDDALFAPSARPGATRARIVAEVGYDARRRAACAKAARVGEASEDCAETPEARLSLAEVLPARALRSLYDHSAVHLNVEWRDLTDAGWAADGPMGPLAAAPRARAVALWRAALALGNGARQGDVPDALRAEVLGA